MFATISQQRISSSPSLCPTSRSWPPSGGVVICLGSQENNLNRISHRLESCGVRDETGHIQVVRRHKYTFKTTICERQRKEGGMSSLVQSMIIFLDLTEGPVRTKDPRGHLQCLWISLDGAGTRLLASIYREKGNYQHVRMSNSTNHLLHGYLALNTSRPFTRVLQS